MGLLDDHLARMSEGARCGYAPPGDVADQEEVRGDLARTLAERGVPQQWLWAHVVEGPSMTPRFLRSPVQRTVTRLSSVGRGWPVFSSASDIRTRADFAQVGQEGLRCFLLADGSRLVPAEFRHVQTGSRSVSSMTSQSYTSETVVVVDGAERGVDGTYVACCAAGPWFCPVETHEHDAWATDVDRLLKDAAYTLERLGWRAALDFSSLRP